MDRELLLRRGRRSYEQGRLRAALRVAWWLVPLVVACALTTGTEEACACIGVALLAGVVYLRWRDRAGAEIVAIGSVAGAPTLLAGLAVILLQQNRAATSLASAEAVILFSVGLFAGAWLVWRASRRVSGITNSLTGLAIAIATMALGCAGAGAVAVAVASAGLVLGGASMTLRPRTAA